MCIIFERKGFWVRQLTNFTVAPAQRLLVEALVGGAAARSWRKPVDPGAVSSRRLLFQMKSG